MWRWIQAFLALAVVLGQVVTQVAQLVLEIDSTSKSKGGSSRYIHTVLDPYDLVDQALISELCQERGDHINLTIYNYETINFLRRSEKGVWNGGIG